MKEHILREMVNDLRDIAIKYHGHQCLRELIKNRTDQAFKDDAEWHRQHLETKYPAMTIKRLPPESGKPTTFWGDRQ